MPCAGCAKTRAAIKDAWHRVKGKRIMQNGDRRASVRELFRRRAQERAKQWASTSH